MSKFEDWMDKPTRTRNGERDYSKLDPDYIEHAETAVFINETLTVCKAIFDDLGLKDESLLLEIYDRFLARLNSLDEFLVTPCEKCSQLNSMTQDKQ